LSQSNPSPKELEDLVNALDFDIKPVNIRLREGEYQFSLAKAIASFELELVFPDAKALIRKLYGETKSEDPPFVAKIQTILKKMEKMGIVKILPKEKPWELQRYALSSFRFQDVEKNIIVLATKSEIEKTRKLMRSRQNQEYLPPHRPRNVAVRITSLIAMVMISFIMILWTLTQPTVNLAVFITAFSTAAICSTILGILIARKK